MLESKKTNDNFKNLINYKNTIDQTFSFPFFIIEYISKTGENWSSLKLMSTCKYLRSLQIRFGFCHIYSVDILYAGDEKMNITILLPILSQAFNSKNVSKFNFKTEFKRIKIWHHFNTECHSKEIEDFVQLTDLTNIDNITIKAFISNFSSNTVQHILKNSCTDLEIWTNYPQKNILQSAFSCSPRLSYLDILTFCDTSWYSIEDFIELLPVERKEKLVHFRMGPLSFDIKKDLILRFHDLHMKATGYIFLCYQKVTNDEQETFLCDFEKAWMDRKENNISTCEINLNFGHDNITFDAF